MFDASPRRRPHVPSVEHLETRRLLSLTLLKDLNTQDVFPTQITAAGDSAYFIDLDAHGSQNIERARLDGRGTSIVFNDPKSTIANLTDFGGRLVFTTLTQDSDGSDDLHLNEVDPATGAVVTIADTADGSLPGYMAFGFRTFGDRLTFCTINEEDDTRNLIATDGTRSGTDVLMSHVQQGAGWFEPSVYVLGDRIEFFAPEADGTVALWGSDGTTAGTSRLLTVPGVAATTYLVNAGSAGGRVFFEVLDSDGRFDLWSSDGTAAGTGVILPDSGYLYSVAAIGSEFYFGGGGSSLTNGLWASDGTAAGTARVTAFGDGPHFVDIENLVASGDRLFFTEAGALWVSDGTDAVTTSLGPVSLGPSFVSPGSAYPASQLIPIASGVAFAASDPAHGLELWRSDGTPAGTGLVKDIEPGTSGSDPTQVALAGVGAAFSAHDADGVSELWYTDGTDDGTVKLATPSHPHDGSSEFPTYDGGYFEDAVPSVPSPVTIGTTTYFFGDDPDFGTELWKTDGTTAGTSLVLDYNRGPADSNIDSLAAFDGQLVFHASAGPYDGQIFSADGTAGDDSAIPSIPYADEPYTPVVMGGALYSFAVKLQGQGNDLVRLSSLTSDSYTVAEVPGFSKYDNSADLTAASDRLFFLVAGPGGHEQLWSSDGQVGGTTGEVGDLGPAPDGPDVTNLVAAGSNVFYTVQDASGVHLGFSDGTAAGTRLFADVTSDFLMNPLSRMTALGDRVVFYADAGPLGKGLFVSDGTTAGTTLLAASATVSPYYGPSGFATLGGFAYYRVSDETPGSAAGLYRTDGTSAGTTLVAAFPGDLVGPLTTLDGSLYLSVETPSGATTLYRSDGTASGTVSLGFAGSNPRAFATLADGSVLVFGDDGTHGIEPMLLDVSQPDAAPPSLAPIAPQSVLVGETLTLTAVATDADPNRTITYGLAPGAPSGATIDATTGAFSWTPMADQARGTYTLVVTATEEASASLSDERPVAVTVMGPNRPPSLAPIGDVDVPEGGVVTTWAVGGDPDVEQGLRYGLAPGAPAWATVDPRSGRITLAPTDGPAGADLTVEATDNGAPALSASRTFHVNVLDVAPTVTLGTDASLTAGAVFGRSGSFTDPGADTWTATVDYGDGSGVLPLALGSDRTFRLDHAYVNPGSYPLIVSVADQDGMVGTSRIFVDVSPMQAPPTPSPPLSASPSPSPAPSPASPEPPQGVVKFAEAIYTVDESAGVVRISVIFTPGASETGAIAIATVDGTAHSGLDFAETMGDVTFAAGETTGELLVPILDAGVSGGERSFLVSFRDPGSATVVGPSSVTVIIRDDDPASPQPATVSSVLYDAHGKGGPVLTVAFAAPVGAMAGPRSHYRLVTFTKGRNGTMIPHVVKVRSASFDGTRGVRLVLARKLVGKIPARLTISGLVDLAGRRMGDLTWAIDR